MEKQNQDIVVAIIVGILFIILFSFLMLIVVVNYVRNKRRVMLEKQKRESQFQQELLQAQIEMQEYTLKTISQEIHDNVGQVLSLAKLNLSILTLKHEPDEQLLTIKDLVGKAIVDLRTLSTGYFGQSLVETGLQKAIKRELEQLEKTGLFLTRFSTELNEIEIDSNKAIFIYRMVQEILNNIIKHSGAKNINITITKQDEHIHISVKDDGRGFDKTDEGFKPGIGLKSMQQRAAMIDAVVNIDSAKGQGTTIELIFK